MKTVNEVFVNQITVMCPYCGEPIDDFIHDPRGEKITCDCGEIFFVEEFPKQIFDL